MIYPDNGDSGKTGGRSNGARLVIWLVLAGVVTGLLILYPAALRFVEMAAREARYLWWLILMVALGIWLIWGFGKASK